MTVSTDATDEIIDCSGAGDEAGKNAGLPEFADWKQNAFRVFVTLELPVALKTVAIKIDNRQCRLVGKAGGKALLQGVWARDVANYTVTSDDDTNTLHIELLKGSAKEVWPALFRVRPPSTEHEVRRVVRAAAGKDGVELSLAVGQLVVLLTVVDSEWAKGSVFAGTDDVGLFRLDDTESIDGAELDDAKAEAMRVAAQLRLAESQEKQDALRKFYEKSSLASAPVAGAAASAAGAAGEWNEQDEIDFSTAYYHAIVTNERAWSDGLQPPRGELSGWLDKMVEKTVGGGSMSAVKGFGKKLLNKMSSQGIEGWQRRFCVVDAAQQSLVYGLIVNEGNLQMQRWEFKGSIFLGGGCQVSVLAFQVSGRPGCVRLRPRIGAKLKDYTLAADTLAIANQWVEALVAAGAVLVDASDATALEPRGVHGGLLFKLGGGALREWQQRFLTIEANGLLSYYEVKTKTERREFHLRGTLQLNFCNVTKHDADTKSTPVKHRYQLTLKQQGGAKDKDYVFAADRHDTRDRFYKLFQEYGAVDLIHPNVSIKPLLRTMPPLPASKRPKASSAAAPAAKPPAKPPLVSAVSAPPARTKPKPMPMTSAPAEQPKAEAPAPPLARAVSEPPKDDAPAPLTRAVSAAARPAMPTPARAKPMPQARPLPPPAAKSAPTTPRETPPPAAVDLDSPPNKPPPARQDLEARKAELAARKAALEKRKATTSNEIGATGSLDRALPSAPASAPSLPANAAGRRHTSALTSAAAASDAKPPARTARPMPTPVPRAPPPAPAAVVGGSGGGGDAMDALDALLDDVEAEKELSDAPEQLERLSAISDFE